jgi:anaerobic dimethyl sulfoxide reductase subunit A
VMIAEDLVDKPFLDKYCVGYDETTLPEGAPAANRHFRFNKSRYFQRP